MSYQDFKCKNCIDVGAHCVISPQDGIETLMRCDCEEGRLSTWDLPRWTYECGRMFGRSPVDPKWFKPPKKITSQGVTQAIDERVNWWREKVRIAEQFWKTQFANNQGEAS